MSGIFTALAVSLTITLTGDILLDRGVRRVIERDGTDVLFSAAIDSVLQTSDLVVGNLECPATDIKAPVYKQYIFRGEPVWLEALKRHGFTHLNMANNHTIDQGRRGLTDTRENIVKYGMTPFGAGQNREEADQPMLLSEKPRRVWMFASLQMALENFAPLPDEPCVSQQTIEELCQRIRQKRAEEPRCYIIVSLHWGWENHVEVVPRQRMEARQLIDAGADCIVGHHTHTRQPSETYKGRPIYYGIGNFIFDPQRPINQQGSIIRLTIAPDTARAEEIPITIRRCTPYINTLTQQ